MWGMRCGPAARKKVATVIIAGQFAKMLKIACGHEQTHVSSSQLDLQILGAGCMREVRNPELENGRSACQHRPGGSSAAAGGSCSRQPCLRQGPDVAERIAAGAGVKVLLAGYGGEVLYFA